MSLQSEKVSSVLALQNLANTDIVVSPLNQPLFQGSVNMVTKRGFCEPRSGSAAAMIIDVETGTPMNGSGLMLSSVILEAVVPLETTTSPYYIDVYSYGNPDSSGSYANYGISTTAQDINGKFYSRVTSNYSTAQETTNAPYFALVPSSAGDIVSGTVAVTIQFATLF